VTINTDASFNHDYKIGAYAYWIVCDRARFKHAGVLKNCQNNIEAEVKAIANALAKLNTLNWTDIYFVIINTDCIPAINLIKEEGKTKVTGTLEALEAINKYVTELRIKSKSQFSQKQYVDYRHVKAHNGTPDTRSYVNNWCDKAAKQTLKKYIQNGKNNRAA
jgi:ribonuclease HI